MQTIIRMVLLGSGVLVAGCSPVRAPALSSPEQQAAAILSAEPAMARTLSEALDRWNARGRPATLQWARIPGSDDRIDLASVHRSARGTDAWSRGTIPEHAFPAQPLATVLMSHERYDCAGNVTPLQGALYDDSGRKLVAWTPTAEPALVRAGSLGQAKEQFLCS